MNSSNDSSIFSEETKQEHVNSTGMIHRDAILNNNESQNVSNENPHETQSRKQNDH